MQNFIEGQNNFMNSVFKQIQNMDIKYFIENISNLCMQYKENIVSVNFEFTINIVTFLVSNLLIPFFLKYEIYNLYDMPYDKIDYLNELNSKNVYLGNVIKKYNLVSLSPYPYKALEIINSCNDNEYYCIMNPKYILIDYINNIKYLCNTNNKIKKIITKDDLLNIEDGHYLYCILPNKIVHLFQGHHSVGSCGQPVICAGTISICNNEIEEIDNSSGHYTPPIFMLHNAIKLLKTKELIKNDGIQNVKKGGGGIEVFEFK